MTDTYLLHLVGKQQQGDLHGHLQPQLHKKFCYCRGTGSDFNSPLYDTYSPDNQAKSGQGTLSPARTGSQPLKADLVKGKSQDLGRKDSGVPVSSLI